LRLETSRGVLRVVREFFVAAEHDNTRPPIVSCDFICFDTDEGILSHPLDLLSNRGETIQPVGFVRKIDRDHVWLVISGAAEATRTEPRKHISTLPLVHFPD